MRTTVDLSDEHRATLHAIAARRGWKGYSRVIQEAVEVYLRHQEEAATARRSLLTRQGAWGKEDAARVRQTVAEVRTKWERRPSRTPTR